MVSESITLIVSQNFIKIYRSPFPSEQLMLQDLAFQSVPKALLWPYNSRELNSSDVLFGWVPFNTFGCYIFGLFSFSLPLCHSLLYIFISVSCCPSNKLFPSPVILNSLKCLCSTVTHSDIMNFSLVFHFNSKGHLEFSSPRR